MLRVSRGYGKRAEFPCVICTKVLDSCSFVHFSVHSWIMWLRIKSTRSTHFRKSLANTNQAELTTTIRQDLQDSQDGLKDVAEIEHTFFRLILLILSSIFH